MTAPAPSGPPVDPRIEKVMIARHAYNAGRISPQQEWLSARDFVAALDTADRAAGVVRVDTTSGEVKDLLCKVIEDEGGGPGNSLHSWRCEYPHPDFPPCTCVSDLMESLLAALREAL